MDYGNPQSSFWVATSWGLPDFWSCSCRDVATQNTIRDVNKQQGCGAGIQQRTRKSLASTRCRFFRKLGVTPTARDPDHGGCHEWSRKLAALWQLGMVNLDTFRSLMNWSLDLGMTCCHYPGLLGCASPILSVQGPVELRTSSKLHGFYGSWIRSNFLGCAYHWNIGIPVPVFLQSLSGWRQQLPAAREERWQQIASLMSSSGGTWETIQKLYASNRPGNYKPGCNSCMVELPLKFFTKHLCCSSCRSCFLHPCLVGTFPTWNTRLAATAHLLINPKMNWDTYWDKISVG